MRKSLMAALLCLGLGAYAGSLRDNCGCGLGSLVFEGHDGLTSQVLAVTTNGTFGNQTFGITSGTLECQQPATLARTERLNIYVASNMDNLARDIAQGQGEVLDTLARLMEVSADERAPLYRKLQANFATIYASDAVTHEDVVKSILDITAS